MYLIIRTQIEFKFKAALRWRWGLVRQIHYSHTWLMGKETLRHNEQWVAAGCSLWALSSRQPLTARHRTDCLRTAWRSRWKGQFVNYVTVYLKRYKCEGKLQTEVLCVCCCVDESTAQIHHSFSGWDGQDDITLTSQDIRHYTHVCSRLVFSSWWLTGLLARSPFIKEEPGLSILK